MQANRLSHLSVVGEGSVQGVANGFVAWPLPVAPAGGNGPIDIYRLAYDQARAAVAPSFLDRVMAVCPN
jgi:hypothetical protein